MNTMYAIGYKFQDDTWFSFVLDDLTDTLDFDCLLPSRSLAEELIENKFGDDFIVVNVDLVSLSERGVLVTEYDIPEVWKYDDSFDDFD